MEKLHFGTEEFIEALGAGFADGRFFFSRNKVELTPLLEDLGPDQASIMAKLNGGTVHSKAMKWFGQNPKAFSIQNGEAAAKMVDQGFLVLLEKYGRFASIDSVRSSLAARMQIPLSAVDVKISTSAAGAGAGWHFDRWDTIQIHLFGAKQWRIATGSQVSLPLAGHVHGTAPDSELASYLPTSDLTEVPADDSFDLEPGDFFYVPNGIWHRTRALESSCTLIVRVRVPAFCDLIRDESLRAHVVRSKSWRQRTTGLWNDGVLNEEGQQQLHLLLTESGVRVPDIKLDWPFDVTA